MKYPFHKNCLQYQKKTAKSKKLNKEFKKTDQQSVAIEKNPNNSKELNPKKIYFKIKISKGSKIFSNIQKKP